MKKILAFTAWLILLCHITWGQSDLDALRFSQAGDPTSSARSLGLAGAIGAVGADASVVLINPAGLAQFRTSTFNLGFGSYTHKFHTDYLGETNKAINGYKPVIPTVSLVKTNVKMTREGPTKKGWVSHHFMIGYNKTADFNRNVSFSGINRSNSLTDHVAEYVEGLPASELDANDEQLNQGFYYFENMFWYGYLIDSASNGHYFGNYDNIAVAQKQSGSIYTKGGMSEVNLALAANYEHTFYIGLGLNIHTVRYQEKNQFIEVDNAASLNNWQEFKFTRNLQTKGMGYSARLGAIYRPNDQMRIGASLHTPKQISLQDEYSDELYVVYDDLSDLSIATINKNFRYTLTTPMKYGVQAAFLFGKKGLITGEVEALDYSTMSITAEDGDFSSVNSTIANKYGTAINAKLAGELNLNTVKFRAGVANYGNPITEAGRNTRQVVSGGFGLHEKRWSFDFGLAKEIMKTDYTPYTVQGAGNAVQGSANDLRLSLTLTHKF